MVTNPKWKTKIVKSRGRYVAFRMVNGRPRIIANTKTRAEAERALRHRNNPDTYQSKNPEELEASQCPQCGATIKHGGGTQEGWCSGCGAHLRITE